MEPIRRSLIDENVDLILRLKQTTIQHDFFKHSVQYSAENLPDGTPPRECMRTILVPGEMTSVKSRLSQIITPVAVVLQKQCQALLSVAYHTTEYLDIDEYIKEFIHSLIQANNTTQMMEARDNLNAKCYAFLEKITDDDRLRDAIEIEWIRLSDMGWRLMSVATGTAVERRQQLNHLILGLGTEARGLYGYIAVYDSDDEIRLLAASALVKHGTHDEYQYIIQTTKDKEARVRIEGIKALGRVWGPRAFKRIAEIIETDVDGEVRRTARVVLQDQLNEQTKISRGLPGFKLLLTFDLPFEMQPLVDTLEARGAEVRVNADPSNLKVVFTSWKPDLAICELMEISKEVNHDTIDLYNLPGFALVKTIRNILGPDVPIIATSVVDPNDIAQSLAELHCIYIRKPATVMTYLRAIESSLSADL
jgi:CheY-like chemotaxis protein